MVLNKEKIDYDERRILEAQLKELNCYISMSSDRNLNKFWFNTLEYRNEDLSICIDYGLGQGAYGMEEGAKFKVSKDAKIEAIAKATVNLNKAMKLVKKFVKGKEL